MSLPEGKGTVPRLEAPGNTSSLPSGRCRNSICSIFPALDAFHVRLQEPEDPLAADLHGNTRLLLLLLLLREGEREEKAEQEEEKPSLQPAPGVGCSSRCPVRRGRRGARPHIRRGGKTVPRRDEREERQRVRSWHNTHNTVQQWMTAGMDLGPVGSAQPILENPWIPPLDEPPPEQAAASTPRDSSLSHLL